MARTFGEITFQLAKRFPGLDQDILQGAVADRYQQILDSHPWTRLSASAILQLVADYTTGTVAITNGLTTLTGTDTVWTSAMTGRRIRISTRAEWYTFTYVSATSATIDRAYEGTTETAGGYKIWQAVYATASDVDVFESVSIPEGGDLDEISIEELDKMDPDRSVYGVPTCYAPAPDTSGNVAQVEFWPGPEDAVGVQTRYKKAVARLADTSTSLLSWVHDQALVAGATAELFALTGGVSGPLFEAKYEALMAQMRNEDNQRRPSRQYQMADRFTDHRWDRATGYQSRRWQRLSQMPDE